MTYRNEILKDKPVGYWRLGEASGTTAADELRNHDGVYAGGGFTYGNNGLLFGDFDTSVLFDGSSYINLGSPTALQLSTLTCEAWLNVTNLTAARIIYSNYVSPDINPYNGFSVELTTSGLVRVWCNDGTHVGDGSEELFSTSTITPGQDYHIVVTRDEATGSAAIYINGVLDTTGTLNNTPLYTNAVALIGAIVYGAVSKLFLGSMDEIAIYDSVLTPSQIRRHYLVGASALSGYPLEVRQDSPTFLWRLGEASGTTATDEEGAYNGTYYGTPTLGVTGAVTGDTAVTFDGVDDYVANTTGPAFGSAGHSLEFFFKKSAPPSTYCGLAEIGNPGIELVLATNGGIGVDNSGVVSGHPGGWGSANVCDGNWHLIQVVRDASNTSIELFVDGAIQVTTTCSSTAVTGVFIGRENGNNARDFTAGTFDEVAAYGYPLTDAQRRSRYLELRSYLDYASRVVRDGATMYWRLGEASGTAIADEIGGFDATLIGTATLAQTGALTGDTDTAIDFIGDTTCYIQTNTGPTQTIAAYEFWAKSRASSTQAWGGAIGRYNTNSDRWAVDVFNSVFPYLYQNSSALGMGPDTNVMGDGLWHHIVVQYTGSVTEMWIDGVKQAATQASNLLSDATSSPIDIGNYGFNSTYTTSFDGLIDEVATYPSPLTGDVIREHYYAGLGKTGYYHSVVSDGAVAYWRLGEASGTTAAEELNSITGTYTGSPTLGETGALGNDADTAVTFDGSTQYVSTGSSAALPVANTAAITVAAWMKWTATGTVKTALAIRATGANTDSAIIIANFASAGDICVYHNTGQYVNVTGLGLNDGAWHHVVGVITTTTTSVYVDGELKGSGSTTRSSATDACSAYIGADYNGSYLQHFPGTIDDVTVWDVALTESQIRDHYIEALLAPETVYGIAGTITLSSTGVARTVRLYNRVTGALLSSTTSSAADGTYSFSGLNVAAVYSVVVLDDDAGTVYNDQIEGQVTPTPQ